MGTLIKGMEEAVLDMCIGEKRRLIVPPKLGRGECGDYTQNEMSGCSGINCLDNNSIIPSGSTLYYDIELIMAKDIQAANPNEFKTIDTNGDLNLSKEEMSIFFKEIFYSSNVDKRVEAIFSEDDKDKNGYISHAEFSLGSKHDDTVYVTSCKDEL